MQWKHALRRATWHSFSSHPTGSRETAITTQEYTTVTTDSNTITIHRSMSALSRKRILKELRELTSDTFSDSISVVSDNNDLDNILVGIRILGNPNYDDSIVYTLSYRPSPDYPFSPPAVMFVGGNIPLHPHIYTNGHICLDILYGGWSPVQCISSVALSLQSMIAHNSIMTRPEGDEQYISHAPSNPQDASWEFHDDNC